ncbi:TPA: hypothetical protein NKO30_007042 [Pseudomonas aeruginosa]|nr:hypothetical protein [Pseudomonas aeruginosa]
MVNDMMGPHITVAELKRALEGARDEAVIGVWIPPHLETGGLWTIHPVLLGGRADGPVFRLIVPSGADDAPLPEASDDRRS